MTLIKDFMKDDVARQSLSELASDIFGIDLETWYQAGYWQGQYIPYALTEDSTVIANASVNRMNYMLHGKPLELFQIGTVMVKEAYRGKGYARQLLLEIQHDYPKESLYLFANRAAVGMYEKLGFQKVMETQYDFVTKQMASHEFVPLNGANPAHRKIYLDAIQPGRMESDFAMSNYGLIGFYTMDLDGIWYCEQAHTLVHMTQEDDTLTLQMIIGSLSPWECAAALGKEGMRVILGFVPLPQHRTGMRATAYQEADTVLMASPEIKTLIETNQLIFENFSHA